MMEGSMAASAFWKCKCGFGANPVFSAACLNCSTGGLKTQIPDELFSEPLLRKADTELMDRKSTQPPQK